MGRIFLVLIVVGIIAGGWGVARNIYGVTHPKPLARSSVESEGEDSRAEIKTPLAASSSEVHAPISKKEPLAVLSSNHEWIQIEAWGIIGPGDELPDGSVLRSWAEGEAMVTCPDGKLERRRFRTVAEALAKIVPAVAAATGNPVLVAPEGGL